MFLISFLRFFEFVCLTFVTLHTRYSIAMFITNNCKRVDCTADITLKYFVYTVLHVHLATNNVYLLMFDFRNKQLC